MTEYDLDIIRFEPRSRQANNPWNDDHDPLWLLTDHEFARFPFGTELTHIDGGVKKIGIDRIDNHTRSGLMEYGLRESAFAEHPNLPGGESREVSN